MTREEFSKALADATAIVDTWPEWKKNIVEYSGKATCSVPRDPVLPHEHFTEREQELRKVMAEDREKWRKAVRARRIAKTRERLKQEMEKEVAALNRIIKGEPPPDACPLCKQPLACGWWCCGCKKTKDGANWAKAIQDSFGGLSHPMDSLLLALLWGSFAVAAVALFCVMLNWGS